MADKTAKKTKVVATKKPNGLGIARDGNKFTFSWKITDADYGDGQQLQYMTIKYDPKKSITHKEVWTTVEVGKKTTSKTVTISTNQDLRGVAFRVRGNRKMYKTSVTKNSTETITTYKPYWSDWAMKDVVFTAPSKPSVSASLTTYNTTTFSWSVSTKASDNKPYRYVRWQTVLVQNCSTTDGSKVSFAGATVNTSTATSGSQQIPETGAVPTGKYTRWFKIWAVGSAGESAPAYARHIYSTPDVATITSATADKSNTDSTELITVNWKSSANSANNPIDSTTVDYTMVEPEAELIYTGSSWTDSGLTVTDVAGSNSVKFTASGNLGADQCLFVRVNNHHDNNTTSTPAYLVKRGVLKDPTVDSVDPDYDALQVEIQATNESAVAGSYLSVYARTKSKPNVNVYLGYFAAASGQQTGVFNIPASFRNETSVSYGVRAWVTTSNRGSMASNYVYQSTSVPVAPTGLELARIPDKPDTILCKWNWNWAAATGAELSWADHDDAWESTDEPSTYKISRLKASEWRISGLDTGKRWYVRVRLIQEGETDTATAWSVMRDIDLSSAPEIPVLSIEPATVTKGQETTLSWVYTTTDGTMQSYAEICEATISGGVITYGEPFEKTYTAQFITIPTAGYTAGDTKLFCVRVVSGSNNVSAWSVPVPLRIVEELNVTVTLDQVAFGDVTVTDDDGGTRTPFSLKQMPFDVTVSGLGASGDVSIVVERSEPYHMDRPDETTFDGYKGEAVAILNDSGDGTYTITNDMLVGRLDDDAGYLIRLSAKDTYGQEFTYEQEFEVHWTHQALMPEAVAEIIDDYAVIVVDEPEGAETGDTFDVYRLSTDKPELIIQDGTFNTAYVDPYPAIGENGGHRIVFKTANGDYITEDKQPAWIDLREPEGDYYESDSAIINFGGEVLSLRYNVDMQSDWSKGFQEVRYLGGSVQGYWNAGAVRSGSIDAVAITLMDNELIQAMRRLAEYDGICHIRTKDGSSFAADIQVSEKRDRKNGWIVPSFSLKYTRVSPEELDGILMSEFMPEDSE